MIKKKIFVTGGSGQDAKILNNIYKKKKKKIEIFFLTCNKIKKKFFKTKFFYINYQNKKKIEKIFKLYKPDLVFHLGANNPSYGQDNYNLFYKKNLTNSKNILNCSINANPKVKFIFANSSQIFKKKKGLVNENSKIIGISHYTKFRIAFHQYVQKIKRFKKFGYSNVILFNHDSVYRNKKFLIPRIINALKKNNLIFLKKIIFKNICGDFSHAEDICEGLYKIAESKKNFEKIILSSGKKTHINDVIKFLINKKKLNYIFDFKNVQKHKCIIGDNSFARKILHWNCKRNIFKAANEMYDYD
jgi:nucleoside-diphosphate-sugar epimerase